jgi:predicted nucleic acid-binding protein
MGLILDSSVLIAAERKGETVGQTPQVRTRREAFIQELLADVPVYPFTQPIALLAGRVDAEQQSQGVKIPFQDLLIGATALHLEYAVVTGNPRHFRMIPGLVVKDL